MHRVHPVRDFLRAPLLAVLLAAELLVGTVSSAADEPAATVRYPTAADFLVIELSSGGPLTPGARGAFTRIYGDGRVHVHWPSYVRRSGDFEAWLTPSDLDSLLHYLAAEGIYEFDYHAVKQQRMETVQRRLKETGTVPGIADARRVTLTLHLDSYTPAGATQPTDDYWKTIGWYALEQDAEWYPGIESVVRLHRAVLLLDRLTQDTATAVRSGDTTVSLPALQRE